MLRARMVKILLQQYLPLAAIQSQQGRLVLDPGDGHAVPALVLRADKVPAHGWQRKATRELGRVAFEWNCRDAPVPLLLEEINE